jgi:hypothetical protein
VITANGGQSYFGGAAKGQQAFGGHNLGVNGQGWGGGASGPASSNYAVSIVGNVGADGGCIVTEYVN